MTKIELSSIQIRTLGDEHSRAPAGATGAVIIPAVTHGAKERRLFQSIDVENCGSVRLSALEAALLECGLSLDDPRLAASRDALEPASPRQSGTDPALGIGEFCEALVRSGGLIERALSGQLVLADFPEFCEWVADLYQRYTHGLSAQGVPDLGVAEEASNRFGVSLCSIDGQRFSLGDVDHPFTAQCHQPLGDCLELEGHGLELSDAIDRHSQSGSIEVATRRLSITAATLANAGVCPTSDRRLLAPDTVQHCLSLMSPGAAPNPSAEPTAWITVHGLGGAVMLVVPGVLGLAVWSPHLDASGDSVRALEFCRELGHRFELHALTEPSSRPREPDLRVGSVRRLALQVNPFMRAASTGDLVALAAALAAGERPDLADYDGRTALHVAAAEGQLAAVELLLRRFGELGLDPNPKDRWGSTPLDNAIEQHQLAVERALQAAGAVTGDGTRPVAGQACGPGDVHTLTDELTWAASRGKLSYLQRLIAAGAKLDGVNYDRRTPLHLAAAEGHSEVVRYLLSHGARRNPRDRWHSTPADDALIQGHTEVVELLLDFSPANLLPGMTPVDRGGQSAA